jgi:hypothetical protein
MGQGWWIGVDDEIVSLIDSRLSCTAFHACMAREGIGYKKLRSLHHPVAIVALILFACS